MNMVEAHGKVMYDNYLKGVHGDVLQQASFQGGYWSQQEQSTVKEMKAAHEPWMSNLRNKPCVAGGAPPSDSDMELGHDDVKLEVEQEVEQEVNNEAPMMQVMGYVRTNGTYVEAGGAGGAARSSSIDDLSGKVASRDPSPSADLPVQVLVKQEVLVKQNNDFPPAKKARDDGGAAGSSSADSSSACVQVKKEPDADAPSEYIEPRDVVKGTHWKGSVSTIESDDEM
jgi:hypothetical protein